MSAPTSDAAIDVAVAVADEIEVAGYGTPDHSLDGEQPTATDTAAAAAAAATQPTNTDDRQESVIFAQQPEHDTRRQGSHEPQGHQAGDGARDAMDGHGFGPENDEGCRHGMFIFSYYCCLIRHASSWATNAFSGPLAGLCYALFASFHTMHTISPFDPAVLPCRSRPPCHPARPWILENDKEHPENSRNWSVHQASKSCRHRGHLDQLRCAFAAQGTAHPFEIGSSCQMIAKLVT